MTIEGASMNLITALSKSKQVYINVHCKRYCFLFLNKHLVSFAKGEESVNQ